MQSSKVLHINWAMPNFVNVCIEECENGEFLGKFYHKYDNMNRKRGARSPGYASNM